MRREGVPTDAEELVQRAIEGDRHAQAELWRAHRGWLASVILAHRPAGLDLEDLLQDVAVQFVRRIGDLTRPAALRGWLRTVAVNLVRDAARRRALRERTARTDEAVAAAAPDPLSVRGPESDDARVRLELAMSVVEGLAPNYREPLLLKSVHGFSQRQIAETLGLPVTTVESRLARARRMVRQALRQEPAPRRVASGGTR